MPERQDPVGAISELKALAFDVETGKQRTQGIRRAVLFGEQGRERVAYAMDAVNAIGTPGTSPRPAGPTGSRADRVWRPEKPWQ